MHEKIPNGLAPEQQQEERVFSDEERLEQFIKDHPGLFVAPLENRRECGPEIEEIEKMIDAFESEHPFMELYVMTEITVVEAHSDPIRESAKVAFSPMLKMLYVLRDETNISLEKYESLKARWNIIANAIGIIKNNRVHHDRNL